jgi:hypothetical protein
MRPALCVLPENKLNENKLMIQKSTHSILKEHKNHSKKEIDFYQEPCENVIKAILAYSKALEVLQTKTMNNVFVILN